MDGPSPASRRRGLYGWTRDLHLYVGLLLAPFVLLFAVTGIMFNHAWTPRVGQSDSERSAQVQVPADQDGLVQAKDVMRQLGITGEIGNVTRNRNRLSFPVWLPGRETSVAVDLRQQSATVRERRTGTDGAILYLHASPGPHNAAIRGNWWVTRVWRVLADGVVYLTLFLTATGLYLWLVLRATRRTGLLMLGAGMLSFGALLLLLA